MAHQRSDSNNPRRRTFPLAIAALVSVILLVWGASSTRADTQARAYLPAVLQQLAGSTNVPTLSPVSTAAATATLTATPSATATSTATLTATPITSACPNVYPIAIGDSLLDANGFVPPLDPAEMQYYVPYNDATYTNKWQRRIYMPGGFWPDSFSFVRWRADLTSGSTFALAAALTGTGTLDQGFDEVVPWPDPNAVSPPGYPLEPHLPSVGDWLYPSTGSWSSALSSALDYQMVNHTLMRLPVVDTRVGTGSAIYYHVNRFGSFLVRGYGTEGAKGRYLDLVYIGAVNSPPCG